MRRWMGGGRVVLASMQACVGARSGGGAFVDWLESHNNECSSGDCVGAGHDMVCSLCGF